MENNILNKEMQTRILEEIKALIENADIDALVILPDDFLFRSTHQSKKLDEMFCKIIENDDKEPEMGELTKIDDNEELPIPKEPEMGELTKMDYNEGSSPKTLSMEELSIMYDRKL